MRREGSRCEKTEAAIEKPIAAPCSTPLSAPVSPVHPEAPLAFVRKSPCESSLARARSTGRCTLGRLFGLRVAARPPFLHCSLARATLVDARRTSRFAAASCRRVDVELANLRPWPEQVTLGRLFLLPGGARPAPWCDSLEDWTQSTMGVGSGFGPPPPSALGADFAAGVGHCARAGAPWVGFSRLQMLRDHALGDIPSPIV